jgi:hypothetical protein
MATVRRFPPAVLRRLATDRILGLRAGSERHRFIGIWVVVARGRVFIRSWTLRPEGWFHTLQSDPVGRIKFGSRSLRVRARVVRSERILRAVDAAYAEKYATPHALRYVQGLRRGRRRASTTELLPD